MAQRERPLIGDRRAPSELCEIQLDHWPAESTSELLDLLHVLGSLVELEPAQAALLARICAAPTLSGETLRAAGAFTLAAGYPRTPGATAGASAEQATLLD